MHIPATQLASVKMALDDGNRKAKDLRAPFKRFAVYLDRVTQNTFKQSGRPMGSWKALSDYTLALRKSRGKRYAPKRILQDSGNLRASFTSRVYHDAMIYGTAVPYAQKHQFGGKTHRGRVEIRPRKKKALAFTVGGQTLIRKLVVLPAKDFDVPARPMLTWMPHDESHLNLLVSEHLGNAWHQM